MNNNVNSYYECLNIDKYTSDEDMKKAYKFLAKKHHPDKGGDILEFQKVNTAYEYFSNTKISNKEKVIHNKFNDDEMNSFFDNISTNVQQVFVNLSLNDIIYGAYKEYQIIKKNVCVTCNATGIYNYTYNTIQCKSCKGIGKYINDDCIKCEGKGIYVLNNINCKICFGKCFLENNVNDKIYIKPGSNHNQIINIHNSLKVILQHKYDTTNIKVQNLHINIYFDITLSDILLGFKKSIHIGYEEYNIISLKYFDFTKPVKFNKKGISNIGDIIVHFKVIYDDIQTKTYVKFGKALNNILGKSSNIIDTYDNILMIS